MDKREETHATITHCISTRRHLGDYHYSCTNFGACLLARLGMGIGRVGTWLDDSCARTPGLRLLSGLFLWLWPRLRLREFWLWLRSRRLRELWLRLSCLQLRQLRLSGVWLWRRLLSASLSFRLLWRLPASLSSRRLRRLSGRTESCDPPRSLALSRTSRPSAHRSTRPSSRTAPSGSSRPRPPADSG